MKPSQLASPEYREQLRITHARENHKWGGGGKSWADEVVAWAREIGAKTAVDYGCGRGTLKASVGDLAVHEYDPGIVGKDAEPPVADMVVSTDVIEHIEPDNVLNVLRHMRALARFGSFHVISLRPAKLILPDGRNAHLSLLTQDEWLEKLNAVGFRVKRTELRKGLVVWTR